MKERPILYSAPMVRAKLAGTKTQTRRVVKPQPRDHQWEGLPGYRRDVHLFHSTVRRSGGAPTSAIRVSHHIEHNPNEDGVQWILCPYGKPGDRLWVRETFITGFEMDDSGYFKVDEAGDYIDKIWYRASTPDLAWYDGSDDWPGDPKWKPSIFMPRAASRLTDEITAVRVECLQDISEADAQAEGIVQHRKGGWHWEQPHAGIEGSNHFGFKTARDAYLALWELINGRASVDANPFVWVIETKPVANA